MRELVVVRHGESAGNVAGIAQGRSQDPLTARGRAQAEAAARLIRAHGWEPDFVVTSPVVRCVETAAILARRLGTGSPRTDEAFTEIDVGSASGRAFADLERERPDFFARPASEWLGFAEFGGESDADVLSRVGRGLDAFAGDERLLLVTHGAVFKGVLGHLLGLTMQFFLELRNGTVMRLERRRVGTSVVSALTHLLHSAEWERASPSDRIAP